MSRSAPCKIPVDEIIPSIQIAVTCAHPSGFERLMMNLKYTVCIATGLILLLATPALAKARGGKVTGVHCAQGPDNAYFPASSFKANIRAKMYKGQKVKFNYPGYGPIWCVVY
jgi:hypothetical protein